MGDDNYNGWWFLATLGGTNVGAIRRVSDYDAATGLLSWARALPAATAAADSYELWPSEYPPAVIHDYIDQAVGEAAGGIYEPVEDTSLRAGGGVDALCDTEGRGRDLEGAGQGIGFFAGGEPPPYGGRCRLTCGG